MKLLSWIRTTKNNGFNPSKEFQGVFCCLRAQIPSEVADIRTNSFSFSGPSHDPNPPRMQEETLFDEDGFCGFLAIGTLGVDPETPKLGASVAEAEDKEMTNLINEKLDKFLEEPYVCPSQCYDLIRSSSTELNNEVKKKKSFLTKLFKRRQTVQRESSYMEIHGTKYFINRIFKKLQGDSSKRRTHDDHSMPKMKDLRKTKVHPVHYTSARCDNTIDDKRSSDLKVPSLSGGFLGSSSFSGANRTGENWIKTDTEYLVLEL